MRKLLLLLVIISLGAKCQNYTISPINLNPIGSPGDLLFAPVLVTNITNDSIQFEYSRIYLNIPSGWLSCVCLPVCMDPSKPMHDRFTIYANSTQTVMPNFQTDTIPGIGYSTFIFYEVGTNIFDTLYFTGTTNATSIKELGRNIDFCIYPNPFNNSVNIKNSSNNINTIKVYNSVGLLLEFLTPYSFQDEIELKTLNYSSGGYFIEIEDKNNKVFRKKIVKP